MNRNFSIENQALVFDKAWPEHHKLELQVGNWAKFFSEQEIKVIIAVALNYCVHHSALKIIGYLITAEKVSLLVGCTTVRWNEIKPVFYEQTAARITALLKQNKSDQLSNWENEISDEQINGLYEEFPFTNQYLILLLTGRKVDLPYYNEELAQLKDQMDGYDFCSAIDYSGAEGPVLVSTSWLKTNNTKKSKWYEL